MDFKIDPILQAIIKIIIKISNLKTNLIILSKYIVSYNI